MRLISLLLFCSLNAVAQTLINSNVCFLNASPITCTLTGVVAGHVLVYIGMSESNNIPTFSSDSAGQTPITMGSAHSGFQGQGYFVQPNATAGTHTITVTSGAPQELILMEWSGLDSTNPIDDWQDAAAGTASATLGVNGPGSLVIAFAVNEYGAGGSWTTPTGLSVLSGVNLSPINVSPGFQQTVALWYSTGVSTGAHPYSSTYSGPNNRTVQMGTMAFRVPVNYTPDAHIRQYAINSFQASTCAFGSATCTCTWPGTVLAGSTLIAFPNLANFNRVNNVSYTSNTGGNTWNTASTVSSPDWMSSGLFYAQNVNSGSPTVSFTSSNATGNYWNCTVMELTGVTASSYDSQAALQTISNTGTLSSVLITTTGSSDIVLMFYTHEFLVNTYFVYSGGFSAPPVYCNGCAGVTNNSMGYAYQIGGPNTYSTSFSSTNSRTLQAGALAFKLGAIPGGVQPVVQVIGGR